MSNRRFGVGAPASGVEMMQRLKAATILLNLENGADSFHATTSRGPIEKTILAFDQWSERASAIRFFESTQHLVISAILAQAEHHAGVDPSTLLRCAVKHAVAGFDDAGTRMKTEAIRKSERVQAGEVC